jgi:nitroimidazol reductase NimA-like FMN-containing flavoprotein (pyridoxamine 5'-phosphate oxidase superfamily)
MLPVTMIGEVPMLTPATKLDQRYSDPTATATGWEETRKVLETAELFWISTVRADGRPHVTPVVAVWAEDAVCFSTGDDEQKGVNLRANPHVVLTTGCNQWDRGLDVVVEGDAVQVTDDAVLKRIAAAFSGRWDGRWQWEVRDGSFRHQGGGAAQVFAVTPVRAFAHAKGDPFGATTHRF